MKDFFEGVQSFFEDFAFAPLNYLRDLELESWFLANAINWIFALIGAAAFIYWMMQLKKFSDEEAENRERSRTFLG